MVAALWRIALAVSAALLIPCCHGQVVPITSTITSSASASASAATTAVTIPSTAANGGITITQPAQTADASYYKIASGVNVTFGWNFTSVLSYPTKLVVQAYCSDNSNTYTIASSIPGTATSVVWAPYLYDQQAIQSGQPALIQATYRLQIYDERGLSVAASPGLFAPNSNVEFALYIPQPYTPIAGEFFFPLFIFAMYRVLTKVHCFTDGWFCSACSGVGSLQVPKPLMIAVMSTCLVMVLGGWNILRR